VAATHVVATARGVLARLRRGSVTSASARGPLSAAQVALGQLAGVTLEPVLQEDLAEASDALAAFVAVILHPDEPAYQPTYANLAGTLAGFSRVCAVGNPDFMTGTVGWSATNASTTLSRSAVGHYGKWSLQVTDSGAGRATAGLTDTPSWVPVTLKGAEQVGLWARASTGAPVLTLQVTEVSGGFVVGSGQVSVRLGPAFQFESLTYQVRSPGASSLHVTISASMAPGEAFLVDDITIVRS
jgi:hypothetical protein